MLIYRIAKPSPEDEEIPFGPYRRDCDDEEVLELSEAIGEAHSWDDDHHPSPYGDRLGELESDEYCGFASMRDLNQWFKGWLNDLAVLGFELYVYDVPKSRIRAGKLQVVAALKPEMLIETKPLIEEEELMEAA